MRTRAHNENGFLLVELIIAMFVLTVALLALIGAFSMGYFAIGSSAKTSAAGLLANNQLELYSALPYASIGLDSATLTSVKSSDANYSTDETALNAVASGTDVTITSCGSTAQCLPVQTLTGADHKTYKLETFIRLLANNYISTRSEKVVTVIVRNMSASGSPKVLTMQSAFDTGPPNSTPPQIANCAQIGVKCESEITNPTIVNNTTLEVVYMDDGPARLGTYTPSAFLNSVQELGVGLSSTSGWQPTYVDSYGGSASTDNQLLITIDLPPGLAPGCYTVLITTSDSDGPDTDQWAWPINVAVGGTVTTAAHC